jgi:diguanylate cyclase (GGDEF)-like protein
VAAERLTSIRGASRREAQEYRMLHRDGRVLDIEATSVPGSYDGRPAVQTHLRDVTDRKRLEAQLVHQAFHDHLTGLANRALFRDRVEHAIVRASRSVARPAVLVLDLDNFKAVNDGIGHVAGDALLSAVAGRLAASLRASDTCARIGGDEFAVLVERLNGTGDVAANAAHLAERIRRTLQSPVSVGRGVPDVVVGVSIGVAVAEEGSDADDVLRNADLAMNRAKSRGRGRFELFEPALHEAARRRLDLESDLRRAVDSCAACLPRDPQPGDPSATPFVLHYQPIAALENGRVRGVEALVRWRHPERGLISPMEFIPIAEETGLIVPLGRWILAVACQQARAWQERTGGSLGADGLSLTVNISPRQLMQPELPDMVASELRASGLAPESLVLEMTESMLVDDSDATLQRLRALKRLGVRLAIDDFGTGYSSLGYLERFPVDLIKIDKSFIDRIGSRGGERESPLARAILGLGQALGTRVVAEGIETEDQWIRLRELGCELGQGYFLSRPMPHEDLARSLFGDASAAQVA